MSTVRPSRSPSRFLHPLVLLALPLAAAPLASAAERPAAGFDPFGEVVDVRLINVEVVVTDRTGARIHGLAPEDFRLLVDGEEVALDFFTEVRDRRAVDTGSTADDATAPPSAPAGEAVGVSYLVYVDDYFPLARDRNAVLDQLAAHLGDLGPADRMAIVAYDDRRLDLLTGWTSSQEELAAAFAAARERPAHGLRQLAELRNHDRTLALAGDARGADALRRTGVEDRAFALEMAGRVRRSVAAATSAVRGFSSAPGRKVLLLLAGGWPYSAIGYASGDPTLVAPGEVADGGEILRPLVDAANRIGYTVYPVDVPGLSRSGGSDVEQGGRLDPFSGADEQRFADFDSAVLVDREATLEDSLRHVARETGGEALINSRRLAALPAVRDDVGNYYWLGFTPPGDADDRRHGVRVVVDRPGLRVRTRQSYLDLTPAAERTLAVEGALVFGGRGGTAAAAVVGGFSAELGAAERDGRRIQVPLAVHIPTGMLTAVPDGAGWLARVELRIGSRDGQRRVSEVAAVPVELRFPEPPQPGRHVTFRNTLRLRNADQVLVIQVTDPVGGATRTTEAELVR